MSVEKRKLEEKIKKLEEREAQIKARKKAISSRLSQEKRKERTKRLIMIGANVEKYADCEVSNMTTFCEYLEKYGYAIKRTQEGSEC